MQSPLDMQDCAHLRDASGPLPLRTSSMMPPMTSSDFVSEMPAGSTLGQTSTHLPHRVQASSISSTCLPRAVSNEVSFIGCMTVSGRAERSATCCRQTGAYPSNGNAYTRRLPLRRLHNPKPLLRPDFARNRLAE